MDEKTASVAEKFGSSVFNEATMRERLPKVIFKQLMKSVQEGTSIDPAIAEVVANAMKDWALEKGATHFTHWFQPMTGITAEKHEAFIAPTEDGKAIMEFSGKELIKGEPDASSFPSGGLRATFEARGYTAWDVTSNAFVKDQTLFIPTAFCSYTGEALDLKTPLLRSMESLSHQAVRILRLFGDATTQRVITTMGPEQEYFLVDEKLYMQRPDLMFTGRTLFGAKPPKGQELEDQYFGSLKDRVADYMHDLDEELWKLGVSARTKHNEVAPAQHELAPIFNSANVATDHNQLTMEVMKKVAVRHGLACLLHEKPFAGVNGSGKHNNWSMATDAGRNLLEPGKTPESNAKFLVFLSAVLAAVDEYSGLLRASVASAANDHRLGANEAPPAIISVYLGDQLTDVLDQIETGVAKSNGKPSSLRIGVSTLPSLPMDTSDRNRTSPFAFTGNKFEFRMVGSSASIAMPNFVLNAIVAESLCRIADRLEKAKDCESEVNIVVKELLNKHRRIVFNGNNYAGEWVEEAKRRGLKNLRTTVETLPELIAPENVAVLAKHGVLTAVESHSRYEIMAENYVKIVNIEAATMVEMGGRRILPAAMKALRQAADTVAALKAAGASNAAVEEVLGDISGSTTDLKASLDCLIRTLTAAEELHGNALDHATYFRDQVIPCMNTVRAASDRLEGIVDSALWPFPTYADLLFRV